MPSFILDASVALSWCFTDEATPETYKILSRLDEESAVVPSLWHLEVANILCLAVRKRRIAEQRMRSFLRDLEILPIMIDTETMSFALTDTLNLCLRYALTSYDAAYLELAYRLRVPLASKDKALCRAAKKLKIDLLDV